MEMTKAYDCYRGGLKDGLSVKEALEYALSLYDMINEKDFKEFIEVNDGVKV